MMHPARGVLLVNSGSPESYSVSDVRAYLDEFLMDERVLDIPYFCRRFIISLFILPFRSEKSAKAYQSIWWPEGSPLTVISEKVKTLLQNRLEMPVELAMRYGRPSIEEGLLRLNPKGHAGLNEILILPLYPHYAMATFETVVTETKRVLKKLNFAIKIKFFPPFYQNPLYLEAMVARVAPYLKHAYDHLLFSYHGLPERHLKKVDPTKSHCLQTNNCCNIPSIATQTCYRYQVLQTTEEVARRLGVPKEKYSLSFQSRMGVDRWLRPFTRAEMTRLAKCGKKRLLVICPAFVSDCLETLEEIGIRGKRAFIAAGGEAFTLIPCLNDHPRWIETLKNWCESCQFENISLKN